MTSYSRSRRSGYVTVDTTVDVDVDEIVIGDPIDDLVEEVVSRGLETSVYGKSSDVLQGDPRDYLVDAMRALFGRDLPRAQDKLGKLISTILPPYVWAAYLAVRDGKRDDAICHLDHAIEAAPSAKKKATPTPTPTGVAQPRTTS